MKDVEIFNDSFQNFKTYQIPKAQLILTDVPYCYDEETECWTTEGWKKYNELTLDDVVLGLNHETQEIEYTGISDIIIRDNTDKMYLFESTNLNLFVTEHHRMWAYHGYKTRLKNEKVQVRKISKENCIKTPDKINSSHIIPRSGYRYCSTNFTDTITIPSCKMNANGQEHIAPPIEIPLSKWLPFFGLWIADGCTVNQFAKNGRRLYCVSIKQFGENRKKVREMLSNFPFKWHEYQEKNRASSNFNIFSKQLWIYLSQFGKSADKFLPRWLLNLNKPYLQLFWDWYTFGDSAKNGNGLLISTISKKLIIGLQEVALKLGTICQVREALCNPPLPKKIYSFTYNPHSRNIGYMKPTIVNDYKGKVWCITLNKNSVFLVRRKGLISFCGNCLAKNAYASNPSWYIDGDNKNGESDKAGKQFFSSDSEFRPAEFMHFCSKMLIKEPKQKGKSPCMILFCEYEQQFKFIELGKKYGLMHYIPLVFRKNFSAQVLKANMKVVGNCEYGLILYRDKLPKFNNNGRMVFNCFEWTRDNITPKIHPCLPTGEKVFINNKWINIEEVRVGDRSSYGEVIDISSREADTIVEIETQDGRVRATCNHPFLIRRGNEIAWCDACQITDKDYILWRTELNPYTNQQVKDILGYAETEKQKWNIQSFGNDTTGKCQKDTKYTTLTEIEQTIALQTYYLSLPLNTKGYTKVADLSMENGKSHVLYVENTNQEHQTFGIIQEVISAEQYAKNATLKNRLKQENFSFRKVGNVKITHGKEIVYNLTISEVPAFDTTIGISHNCQKPIPLLENLIELFTDKGDVVIDPCAGSGTTLLAAANLGRKAYGFEVNKQFYQGAKDKVLKVIHPNLFQ